MDIAEHIGARQSVNYLVGILAGIAGKVVRKIRRPLVVSLVLMTMAASLPVDAATLYRYINDKGYQEIGYSIPNHLVPNGYDVIDETGRLVRRVAAQLSEEEYAAKLERERKLEACEKAMDRVHRRYETITDIDTAERVYEEQLEESLRNDQANLEYSLTALGDRREQAAGLERAGRSIPKELQQHIENTELQIQNLTAQMDGREQGAAEKAREFNEERRVFQLIDCNADQVASAG